MTNTVDIGNCQADMSKISLQSGVGAGLLSPSIAFTPLVSRGAEAKERKESSKERYEREGVEAKDQAENWEIEEAHPRNESVGEETGNQPSERSPVNMHTKSSLPAKSRGSPASRPSPGNNEVRSPAQEMVLGAAHAGDVPHAAIASNQSAGQSIAQGHIGGGGGEEDCAAPDWMLPVDDEGKMLEEIDSVNRLVAEGGAIGGQVLQGLAMQPGMYARDLILCGALNTRLKRFTTQPCIHPSVICPCSLASPFPSLPAILSYRT